MESNDLRIFYKVAQLGSISRAAEELGYVQSNVTLRIKSLEKELAVPLFVRTNRGVQLLPDGELLFSYAEKILALLAEASTVISQQKTILKIGAPPSITTGYLTPVFTTEQLSLSVYTRPAEELIALLLQDKLDLIFLNRFVEQSDIIPIFSYTEAIGWLTAHPALSLQDIAHYPILVSRDKNCPYRKAALAFLKKNNITRYQLIEYDILEPILSSIEANAGISVLPLKLKSEKMFCATDISLTIDPVKIFLYMKNNNMPIAENIQVFIKSVFNK